MGKVRIVVLLAVSAWVLVSACAPAAQPTPTPAPATAKPAAAVTASPAGAAATAKPAAAAPTATQAAAKAPLTTVKMSGIAGSLSDSGLLIAQDKGYFQQEGVNVDYVTAASGADVIAETSTGELDATGGGWSVALANADLRGIPIKVVADKMSKQPGFSGYRISFRKDLYDSGQLKDISQLKGKKLGVTSVAAMGNLLAPALKQANLTLADMDVVPLNFPDMVAALSNKSLDAAVLAEPLLAKAVDQGLVVKGKDLFDFDPSPSAGVIYFSPQFAQKTDAANAFIRAYIRGLRDYVDAFTKNKGRQEVVAILAKRTGIDASLFDKMDLPGFNPDGYVDRTALQWATNYWISDGELKGNIDLNKIIDNSFVDNAIKKLGKYAR